jgi:hypothetical protein
VKVRGQRGAALVLALFAISFLMALGSALILLSTAETLIAANHRVAAEAFYAVDAALERTLVDLNGVLDWNPVLAGVQTSTFVDGPPGVRTLADGTTLDLAQVVNLATCRKTTPCSPADVVTISAERPWGPNNPRWQLYAHGPLSDAAGPGSARTPFYGVVLVGDDPSENDADPARDGDVVGGVSNPGVGLVMLRAEAFGPRHAHRAIEATIARFDTAQPAVTPGVRVMNWRSVE